jgi:hypothetical protein
MVYTKEGYEKYKVERKQEIKDANNTAQRENNKKTLERLKTIGKKVISSKKLTGTNKTITKPTYKKTLSTNLMNQFTESAKPRPVGRPQGVMKHVSPFTGKPVPAEVYYSQVREVKRLQAQQADKVQLQKQQQFAKQGVAPNQVQNVIQQRMQQQFIRQQQMQSQVPQRPKMQTQQVPNNIPASQLPEGTIVPAGNHIWRYGRGVVGHEAGLFGPVKKIYGTEKSFFN